MRIVIKMKHFIVDASGSKCKPSLQIMCRHHCHWSLHPNSLGIKGQSYQLLLQVCLGLGMRPLITFQRSYASLTSHHFLLCPSTTTLYHLEEGKYCLTGGHDRSVRLWNPFRYDPAATSSTTTPASSTGRPSSIPPALPIQTYTAGYTHPITSVTATESRTATQILVAASRETLVVSDLITQQLKRRFQGHHVSTINAVAAAKHAEAYLSASYDGTVAIWDGRSSDTRPIQVLKDAKDSVTDVHIVQNDSDCCIIRTSSVDGKVRTYDVRKGLLHTDDCGSPITSMALTKDGECLAVSCLDGTIRLLQQQQPQGGEEAGGGGELLNTFTGHQAGNYALQVGILANDETILSASEDGTCILYDLVRATRVQALQVAPGRPVCAIATHPKHSSVVITASYNETTTVWSHDSSQFYAE